MATLKSIAFVIIAASTTCQAIEGPTVSLVTPRHGEQYRQRVQINLHVEIGEVLASFSRVLHRCLCHLQLTLEYHE